MSNLQLEQYQPTDRPEMFPVSVDHDRESGDEPLTIQMTDHDYVIEKDCSREQADSNMDQDMDCGDMHKENQNELDLANSGDNGPNQILVDNDLSGEQQGFGFSYPDQLNSSREENISTEIVFLLPSEQGNHSFFYGRNYQKH